jgi:hypothetical protein
MGKTTAKSSQYDPQVLIAEFTKFVEAVANGSVNVESASDDVDEVEEDEDAELEPLDREEVEGMGIKDLRELAGQYLDDPPKKKAEILDALEEFYVGEDEDEDDEDLEEAEEDDEDEDEDEGYSREDLEDLDLKALRKIAKDNGASASDVKGKDSDDLIDLILGEEAEEDEEEEDEDEEDEEEVLDEDALKAMSESELKNLSKELEIKVPKKKSGEKPAQYKKRLVAKILESGEEE